MNFINLITIVGAIAGVIGAIHVIFVIGKYIVRKGQIDCPELPYPPDIIKSATRYYIPPYYSHIDPTQETEIKTTTVAKGKLFDKVDNILSCNDPEFRHLLLLADSGMGKSAFVLNYSVHYKNLLKKKRQCLALVLLGMSDADENITKIKNKPNTVLFLDAFDEYINSIENHGKRLRELMSRCQQFNRVVVTCRTQFFDEIQEETGIPNIWPGKKGTYKFGRLYILPFDDNQVNKYLKKLYPVWKKKKRKNAQKLVKKIPLLSVRPMLLAHIPDLINSEMTYDFTFQLYEKMVEAWTEREEGKLGVRKEPLRQFSEKMAVNLYLNRERRGAEQISDEELTELAKKWNIPLQAWQLTGRSLLNRDGAGNYKFAHRSILEYLFAKYCIEGDDNFRRVALTEQMQAFVWEMLQKHIQDSKTVRFDISRIDLPNYQVKLRSTPARNFSLSNVKEVIKRYKFFENQYNKEGTGIPHLYHQLKKYDLECTVVDYVTNIMLQQSGSSKLLSYEKAQGYIDQLNADRFAGHSDWRLPTFEEAMSLMRPQVKNGDLCIDALFNDTQQWIWTSDNVNASRIWVVDFNRGLCFRDRVNKGQYVRAVR